MTEERFAKPKPRRWWLAGLLSLLQPGLGQIYNGQALKGTVIFLVVWVICTVPVSYMLVMHLSVSVLLVGLVLGLAVLAAIVADAIVCARKTGGSYSLKPYNRVFVYIGVFLAFSLVSQVESWVVKTHIIQAFRIPAASMAPTLLVGDHILVNKLHGAKRYPKRGDVVVFDYPADPSKEFIKRVEGVAGRRRDQEQSLFSERRTGTIGLCHLLGQ